MRPAKFPVNLELHPTHCAAISFQILTRTRGCDIKDQDFEQLAWARPAGSIGSGCSVIARDRRAFDYERGLADGLAALFSERIWKNAELLFSLALKARLVFCRKHLPVKNIGPR